MTPADNVDKLSQLQVWRRQIAVIAAQMEEFYGEHGSNNPDALDAATHVALFVADGQIAALKAHLSMQPAA